MERKKRLGKGLEDISHFFLSSVRPSESKPALTQTRPEPATHGSLPRLIAVTSRTLDIPTIFWTSSLALSLSQCGKKALVIDVGTDSDELASVLKSIAIHPSLGDLLNQPEKAITVESPLGFRVLAFQMQLKELRQFKQEEREILFQILRREEQQADLLLLNIPLDLMRADVLSYLRCLCEAVLVIAPQDLLESYRILKVLFRVRPSLHVGLVEYRGFPDPSRGGVHRLVIASKEFLKQSPLLLGEIPADSSIIQSVAARTPLLFSNQEDPATWALLEIGKKIIKELDGRESRTLFFDAIQAQLNAGS